jgi:Uma2 family endonuclease
MTALRALPPGNPAPWAEIVPGVGPMTVEDLLHWPDDDGYRYELIEGVLVRVAIVAVLKAYVRPRRLGRVTGADGVYKFTGAETGLLPDAGFYVAARGALVTDRTKPIPFAPDLAVEVASPRQTQEDMGAKAALYIGGGTRLVWIVWPQDERIDVWHPGDRVPTALRRRDMLDGEDVISGLRRPVDDIFTDDLG